MGSQCQKRVAIIQAGEEKRNDKLHTGILCEIATDGGNTTKVKKANFDEEDDVRLHRQSGVKIHAKALDSRGKRHSSVSELKVCHSLNKIHLI